jgi:RNA polymerase sigma-70 factor (ECF subfamily)
MTHMPGLFWEKSSLEGAPQHERAQRCRRFAGTNRTGVIRKKSEEGLELGSSKGHPGWGARRLHRPQLRRLPGRPGDARRDSHVVLEQVERSWQPSADVAVLARQAKDGDDLAFAELYVVFAERVHRYLLVALKNPDDAQEVAQDVFARALARIEQFDPERGDFRDWLFSMVRSVAIDHLRKGARADEVALSAAAAEPLPVAAQAASLLERLDPESGARSLIHELPHAQRRVLALRFVFGLNTVEISDVTGSTPDAVRHIQHRALKALAGAWARPRDDAASA